MLRGEKTLPHHRNRAHQRTGKTAAASKSAGLKSHMLKNIRANHHVVWIPVAQRHKRARAPDDSVFGHNIA